MEVLAAEAAAQQAESLSSFLALEESYTQQLDSTIDPSELAQLNQELHAGLSADELEFLAKGTSHAAILEEPIRAPAIAAEHAHSLAESKAEPAPAPKTSAAPAPAAKTEAKAGDASKTSAPVKPSTACGAVAQCVHGMCVNDQCMCAPGYAGPNCNTTLVAREWKRCPNGCSGNGVCVLGRCVCDLGFGGVDCSERKAVPCPRDCSGHGICYHGKCFCEPGFGGVACAVVTPCPSSCGAHGVCFRGRCVCAKGFFGEQCQHRVSDDEAPASIVASEDDMALLRYTNLELEDPSELQSLMAPIMTKQQATAKPASKPAAQNATAAPATATTTKTGVPPANTNATHASFVSVEEELETAFALAADEQAFACEGGCSLNGRCVAGQCYCAPGYSGVRCEHQIDPRALEEAEEIGNTLRVHSRNADSNVGGAVSSFYETLISAMRGQDKDAEPMVVPHVTVQKSAALPPIALASVSFFIGMFLFSMMRRLSKAKAL